MSKPCIFKVLASLSPLKIPAAESLVFQKSSEFPYLVTSNPEGFLNISECQNYQTQISSWLTSGSIEILSKSSSLISKDLKVILSNLSENCIITKHVPNSLNLNIFWTARQGVTILHASYKDQSIVRDVESLRKAVDKALFVHSLKLQTLRAVFQVAQQTRFLAVSYYTYIVSESIILKLPSSKKTVPRFKRELLTDYVKTIPCSPVLTPSLQSIKSLRGADSIESKISEIMKRDEEVRFMTYKSWVSKIKTGEAMLPNEQKFAKKLAAFGKKNLQQDPAREVKKLMMKLEINLDSNRNKRYLQEAVKEGLNGIIKKKVKFSSLQEKEKPKKSVKEVSFPSQVDLAVGEYEKLQKSLKRVD